jgi:hypothetical protein
MQTVPASHRPHAPPQPSSPHALPSQAGTHSAQVPASHTSPAAHWPQVPPHPSSPHALPSQAGTQQRKSMHFAPPAQGPQSMPQKDPHSTSPQVGFAGQPEQSVAHSAAHAPAQNWSHSVSQQ